MDVGQNIQSEKVMRYYWKVIVWPRQASSTGKWLETGKVAWLKWIASIFGVHYHRDLDVPYFGDCSMLSVRLLITTVVRWYSAHWNLWSGRSCTTWWQDILAHYGVFYLEVHRSRKVILTWVKYGIHFHYVLYVLIVTNYVGTWDVSIPAIFSIYFKIIRPIVISLDFP